MYVVAFALFALRDEGLDLREDVGARLGSGPGSMIISIMNTSSITNMFIFIPISTSIHAKMFIYILTSMNMNMFISL